MSNFIIDTPYHKRWWLPDNRHQINSVIYGDDHLMQVIDSVTGYTKQSFTVKLSNPQSNDLWDAFQESARKKYPKQLRHKSISESRQRIGL